MRIWGSLFNYWRVCLSAENISKAYQLRDRASDAEKFFITASYDIQVTGNLEKRNRPVSCGPKPILVM